MPFPSKNKILATTMAASMAAKAKMNEAKNSKMGEKVSLALDKTKEASKNAYVKAKEEGKQLYNETKEKVIEQREIMKEQHQKAKKELHDGTNYNNNLNSKQHGNKIPQQQSLSCASCHKSIDPSKPYSYIVDEATKEQKPVHVDCFSNMLGIHCYICDQTVPKNESTGQIEFGSHLFFKDEKMCGHHKMDGPGKMRQCTSCTRYEPEVKPFEDLSDDGKRCVCDVCEASMPTKNKHLRPLWEQVVTFFEDELELPIVDDFRDVKLKLVEEDTLKDKMKQLGLHKYSEDGMERGLCLTESPDGTSFTVSAILCLQGLAKDLSASVLAHEGTHAWIKLHPEDDISKPIPPQVEEGVCQLISYLFLKDGLPPASKETDGTKKPSEKKLRQFFMYSIKNEKDAIYGDGFRMAYAIYEKVGIQKIMDHVIKHRDFPSV